MHEHLKWSILKLQVEVKYASSQFNEVRLVFCTSVQKKNKNALKKLRKLNLNPQILSFTVSLLIEMAMQQNTH